MQALLWDVCLLNENQERKHHVVFHERLKSLRAGLAWPGFTPTSTSSHANDCHVGNTVRHERLPHGGIYTELRVQFNARSGQTNVSPHTLKPKLAGRL